MMTVFVDILQADDRGPALLATCAAFRSGESNGSIYEVQPDAFADIPTSAIAYWTTPRLRAAFRSLPKFQSGRRHACKTNPAGDDNRYLRLWWETKTGQPTKVEWHPLAKGGNFSPYYYDVHLVVAWNPNRRTYLGFVGTEHRPLEKPASLDYFFRPGITWPSRTETFGPRLMPAGTIFTGKGPAAFDVSDDATSLLATCAVMNSKPFQALLATRLNAADLQARSYEVGMIQLTSFPILDVDVERRLADLAFEQWKMRRRLDTIVETSHAFILPGCLLPGRDNSWRSTVEFELMKGQREIDALAYKAYGLTPVDCMEGRGIASEDSTGHSDEDEDDDSENLKFDDVSAILSWCVGVVFGRFNWRLAIGEDFLITDPGPFDPLPIKSPGMLSDDAEPFHVNAGILVDDPGHPLDISRLVEEVMLQVNFPVPNNVRRWLQRDFFAIHLQRYSKSRRRAPIYLPIGTQSGSYTLWVYCPRMSTQTLYTVVNDFVEPKLNQVGVDVAALRSKGTTRSRDEEKQLEVCQSLEIELVELRDLVLKVAEKYRPTHDDGVQILAAPLWPLFSHKPWQKILKGTWSKLEIGDFDWALSALNYWPDRVRQKCKTDKSLAITHGLEDLYVEPAAKPKKSSRGHAALDVGS